MNAAEKIVQTYLRLNGFFVNPKFTVMGSIKGHVDFLAVRLGGCEERIGVHKVKFDEELLSSSVFSDHDNVGLVVEVKGGGGKPNVSQAKFDYVARFFGNTVKVKKAYFGLKGEKIEQNTDSITVPIRHCLKFILQRFEEINNIRKRGEISKVGTWVYSEDLLSDLLYLKKTGFLRLRP